MATEEKRETPPPSLPSLPVSPPWLKKAEGKNDEKPKPASTGDFGPVPVWGPKTTLNSISAASASFEIPGRIIPNRGATSPNPPTTSKKPLFSGKSSSPPKAPKESIFNSSRFSSQPSSSSPKSTASTPHSRTNSNTSPKTPRFATAHSGPSAFATPVTRSGEKSQPSPTKSILKNPSVSSTSSRVSSRKEPTIQIDVPPNADAQETGSNLSGESKLSDTKVELPDWVSKVAGWFQKKFFGFDAELASREAAKLVEGLPDPVSRTNSRIPSQISSSLKSTASTFSSHSSAEEENSTTNPTESSGNPSTGQKILANSYLSGVPVYYLREHVEKTYTMVVLKSQEVWWWGWAMGILTVLFLIELTGLLFNGNLLSFAVLIEIWLLGRWITRRAHFPWYKYGITEQEGRQAVENGRKRDWWGNPRALTTAELQVTGTYAQDPPGSTGVQQPRWPKIVAFTPSIYPQGTEPVPREHTEVRQWRFVSQGDVAADPSQPIFPLSSAAWPRCRTEGACEGRGMQRFTGSPDNKGTDFSPSEG